MLCQKDSISGVDYLTGSGREMMAIVFISLNYLMGKVRIYEPSN